MRGKIGKPFISRTKQLLMMPGRKTNIDCKWSGVQLNGAHFEANTAMSGGAFASENRNNLLLDVKNTTFTKNVAVGSRGGAVHISGSGIGAMTLMN